MKVVFLLVPHLHLLDLAGAAQVFSSADDFGYRYRLEYVAEREDIPTAQGVRLRARTGWPELMPEDLVIVPGWQSTRDGSTPLRRETLDRLVRHHANGGRVASVCSGADALGQARLLDGRRFTTHHELQDLIAGGTRARCSSGMCFTCSTIG